jgi:4-hydroxy-3-methylbut-2-enyl diphosphate reductase IspH
VVVGGRTQRNTRELVNLARMQGKTAYHIGTPQSSSRRGSPAWTGSVLGGCSTPMETLLEVKERAEARAK